MKKQKLVLIGNGMAGLKTIEHLLQENTSLYEMTIFGSEPYTNYSRIMLSSVLQGDITFDDITIHDWKWYEENEITLYPNETVLEINRKEQFVYTDKNRKVNYDRLIIATGSNPFILPLPGANKEGVMAFRTIDDCKQMIEASKKYKKAAVIGGGLLGLEAARGLLNLGMEVDVIHLADQLLNNQLDQTAGIMLKKELEVQGMQFLLGKDTAEIYGDARAEGLRFKDGTSIEADLVIMAVGIKPNISLAKETGLEINRGIVVDQYLQTNDEHIYAVGECAEHNGIVYGLVKPLYEQADILAKQLTKKAGVYQGSTVYTQLKISGIDLFSVGQIKDTEQTKSIFGYDEINGTYQKVLFEQDKAVGAVLYGDTSLSGSLLDIIWKRKYIPDHQKPSLLQPVNINESYAATLPRNENVCTCNSVSKSCIIEQVVSKDLQTVEDVKSCTKASSSCGGCKPVVQELLDYIHSDYFHETVQDNRFCTCTPLTEDEIVSEIQYKKLTSLSMIFQELAWNNATGCSTCLPALNYYLEMIYPQNFMNNQIFYLDPKTNAILETDGTYTIIPQTYGGIIHTNDLHQVSKLLRHYQLDNIYITTEQRLKICHIPEEHLLPLCRELNMLLHGYTNYSIKSIAIPESSCQCNKLQQINLATQLEKQTEFVNLPYQVTIKLFCCREELDRQYFDLAILQTKNSWDLITQKDMQQQILYATDTAEEMTLILLALIQYYRQSGNFQENLLQWIERAGPVHIREVLLNREFHEMLCSNLQHDQTKRKQMLVRNLQP
ncbi:nitrite reductase large subunit NirB [Gracilibacillus caseinilyticus]|uniref:Nitrite reductase large subunit NirB n=1 Tax=Gracilibacillus caseinilyticus TaxID=2932256 RepID=A0ABY4EUH8_9BACI|nr:nitrite reductase large subunit NirB [Gracilibacillus caseinilyticus]UOQ48069.1 nitrite reductase large subunit NirB [Gracilibacillus caseinilyticus]